MHPHTIFVCLDALVVLTMANQHTLLAQMVGQRVDDFIVEKSEQLVARVDEIDLDAQAAKNRRVLAADDPCAVNRNAARRHFEL